MSTRSPSPSDDETLAGLLVDSPLVLEGLARREVISRLQAQLFGDCSEVTIGRYRVLNVLGQGGMGIVYSAQDPRLGRKVALKAMHTGRAQAGATRARLRREARAMARLSHPNVVPVYEVLDHDGEVVVAMEWVDGSDLAAWVRPRRSWGTVVRALVDAGRGLAAAHSVGVVHRDFKPQNVLIGADGRARVTDFGLARDGQAPVIATSEDTTGPDLAASDPLTRTGALLGTPAYIAPECYAGQPADERSDQFAFAVTSYELLCGERPFRGDSLGELARRIGSGQPQPLPASAAPRRVRRAILRGLQANPSRRHPSVAAMVDELEAALRSTGRRAAWGGGAAVLSLAVVGWGVRPAEPCASAGELLASVWTDERERELARAFEGSGITGGSETWLRVRPSLRAWVDEWSVERKAACHAREPRRIACLDSARRRFSGVVRALQPVTDETVRLAVEAIDGLHAPTDCRAEDSADGHGAPLPPVELQEALEGPSERLAEAEALNVLGRGREARVLADVVVAEADEIGWPVLQGRARLERAIALYIADDEVAANAEAARAFGLAIEAGDPKTAVLAALELADGYGGQVRDDARADMWLDEAERALRLGVRDDVVTACRIEVQRVANLRKRGDLDGATDALDGAKARCDRARITLWLQTRLLWESAAIAVRQARYDDAEVAARELVAFSETNFGRHGVHSAHALTMLANVLAERRELEQARRLYEESRVIRARVHGEPHTSVASIDHNLALLAARAGDFAEAERRYSAARDALAELGHDDSEDMLDALEGLVQVRYYRGDNEGAREIGLELLAKIEASRGTDDASLFGLLVTMVNIDNEERPVEAMAWAIRARDLAARTYGDRHPYYAVVLFLLAQLQIEVDGDHEAALESIDRSLAIREEIGVDPPPIGDIHLVRAKVLAGLGRTAEARDVARQAAEELRDAGPLQEESLREAEGLLETLGPERD
jgi:tetratricopeptide (TPR) repeat protein/predicted Ser/Thr protein kinase